MGSSKRYAQSQCDAVASDSHGVLVYAGVGLLIGDALFVEPIPSTGGQQAVCADWEEPHTSLPEALRASLQDLGLLRDAAKVSSPLTLQPTR